MSQGLVPNLSITKMSTLNSKNKSKGNSVPEEALAPTQGSSSSSSVSPVLSEVNNDSGSPGSTESKSGRMAGAAVTGVGSPHPAPTINSTHQMVHRHVLFDIDQQRFGTPPILGEQSRESYNTWKGAFTGWAKSNGTWDVFNTPFGDQYTEAELEMKPLGATPQAILRQLGKLNSRLCGSLMVALGTEAASGIINTIAFEQSQLQASGDKSTQLADNCNYFWTKIKELFEKKAGGATVQVLNELINFKMEPNEVPVQYHQRFLTLIHRVNTIEGDVIKHGQRLSEGFKLAIYTRGLPRHYNSTIQTVLTANESPDIFITHAALQRQYDNSSIQDGTTKQNHAQALASLAPADAGVTSGHSDTPSGYMRGRGRGYRGHNGNGSYRGGRGRGGGDRNGDRTSRNNRSDDGDQEFNFVMMGNEDGECEESNSTDEVLTSQEVEELMAEEPIIAAAIGETRSGYALADTAASHHIVFNKDLLTNLTAIDTFKLFSATGHHAVVKQQGSIELAKGVNINNVCYSATATHNLLSVSKLFDEGCECVAFNKHVLKFRKVFNRANGSKVTITLTFNREQGSKVWKMHFPDLVVKQAFQRKAGFSLRKLAPAEGGAPLPGPAAPASSSSSASSQVIPKKVSFKPAAQSSVPARPAPPGGSSANGNVNSLVEEDVTLCMNAIDPSEEAMILQFYQKEVDQAKLLHTQIGHQSKEVLSKMNEVYQLGISRSAIHRLDSCVCDSCVLGKGRATRIASAIPAEHKPTKRLEMVFMDIFGPMSFWNGRQKVRIPTPAGNLYGFPLVDGHSHYVTLRLLANKSEATTVAIDVLNSLSTRTGDSVQGVHSDAGGEFVNRHFDDFVKDKGIKFTYTTANHPEHNAVVERMNGILKEIARSNMAQSGAPLELWGEAMNYATFQYNNTPQPAIGGRIPAQVMFGKHASIQNFKVFGCDAFYRINEDQRGALQPRFARGMFVGIDETRNCYRIMDLKHHYKVHFSRDVKFMESSFTMARSSNPQGLPELDYDSFIPLSSLQAMSEFHTQKSKVTNGSTDPSTTVVTDPPGTLASGPKAPQIEANDDLGKTALAPITYPFTLVTHETVTSTLPQQKSDISANFRHAAASGIPTSTPIAKPSVAGSTPHTGGLSSTSNIDTDHSADEQDEVGSLDGSEFPEFTSQNDTEEKIERLSQVEPRIAPVSSLERLVCRQPTPSVPRTATIRPPTVVVQQPIPLLQQKLVNPTVTKKPAKANKHVQTKPTPQHSARKTRTYGAATQRDLMLIDDDGELRDDDRPIILSSIIQDIKAPVPETYNQAMSSPNKHLWIAAMQEELNAHQINGTWAVEDNPRDHRPISAKWVYDVKRDANNNPIRYKCRLVARGFQQSEGIDYDETFAPVAKMKSVKLLLALAAHFDLEVKQLDFDTAFLNATLSHTVYMKLPPGCGAPPGTVVRLVKSLYGLKQAGHDWNELIVGFIIKSLGYTQLKCDTCLFIKRTADNRCIILALYVDDTPVLYDKLDEDIWLADKAKIESAFKIKDIGDCTWFLNMRVTRDRTNHSITLSQSAYVEQVLERFAMSDCKPVVNPCVDYDLYHPPEGVDRTPLEPKLQNLYQQIVGALNYAAETTRPDISYAVNQLGRFNAQAQQHHFGAAKHVLRYLRGTANLGLEFKRFTKGPIDVSIFTDASWGNDLEDRRSTSGMIVRLNGNPITWSTKKQKTVARSSTEAEYVAGAMTTSEAIWMITVIEELLGIRVTPRLLCDNQSAIMLVKNDAFHQRTKHIDISHHFIREQYKAKNITIEYCPTEKQDADILTKAISTGKAFQVVRDRIVSPTT